MSGSLTKVKQRRQSLSRRSIGRLGVLRLRAEHAATFSGVSQERRIFDRQEKQLNNSFAGGHGFWGDPRTLRLRQARKQPPALILPPNGAGRAGR
jgi:hypothetical protein